MRTETRPPARTKNLRGGLLLLALLAGAACGTEPPATIQSCLTCHGVNGVASQPKTPHLNGQLAAFLGAAMQAYASGSRPTDIVQHKSFPSGDTAAMAAYFSSQKDAIRPKQETDPLIVAKGQKIYNDRCAECHMDDGRDADKDAPLMAAQNKEFLAAQTLLFKSGARKFPFMMDDSYRGLSEPELTAVAEYFAAQEQFAPPGGKKKRRKP